VTQIAIIVGSTRPGRKAESVAGWAYDIASARDDATFHIVDLADYNAASGSAWPETRCVPRPASTHITS
jgi:NAD(P)H-dependent FMN reductase